MFTCVHKKINDIDRKLNKFQDLINASPIYSYHDLTDRHYFLPK